MAEGPCGGADAEVVGGAGFALRRRLDAEGAELRGEALDELINAVEDTLRLQGGEVSSEAVGRSVLERLREADPVAAVRFASVYLGFDDLGDFEREIKALSKRTEPKRH